MLFSTFPRKIHQIGFIDYSQGNHLGLLIAGKTSGLMITAVVHVANNSCYHETGFILFSVGKKKKKS